MKTDCGTLGKQALERLRSTCERADEIQREMLFELLEKNRDTEFGRKYGFSDIKTVTDFQGKIPLSDYNGYSDQISRIIKGEENILTAENPIFFCISSGTTGDEKFVPVTESDIKIQYLYDYGLVFGAVDEYYGNARNVGYIKEEEIFGKLFQVGEFAKTYMGDGRMKGIRSGCVYQWLDRRGEFDASDYCVPKEILFPDTLEDQLYTKARFALAERDLTAIHGVFVNRVAGVMDYILQNWDMLLEDTEQGKISADIDEKQREIILKSLPPDPVRAKELKAIPREDLHIGTVRKIWKKMKYILAIGGASFPHFTEKMLEYAGDVPICHYAYAASECVFGVAEQINVPDRYILFPEAAFFEFIPVKEPDKILLMSELQIGEKYEIVFTNRSGLYRYRLGDVAEAVGRCGSAPVVKYCYRINQAINIAGEKTNCEQLSLAVKRFSEITEAKVTGYCVCEDDSGLIPKYLFYIECGENNTVEHGDIILEECMRETNFDYRSCENMNEIAPLKLLFLKKGSFEKYEQSIAGAGKPMGQNKLLRFLDTAEKKEFFAKQVLDSFR